jgi:2-hydroxychromene-2-carboxylate isomerase
MKRIEFYYDVVCPYAYLASTRVEALAARVGAELQWRPILLGGVFRAIGSPDVPAAAMPPAKARLNYLDMKRYASLYGVPLGLHPLHPRRSVEAMRLCHLVDGEARVRLSKALYRVYFAEQRDIADRAVLTEIAGADLVARVGEESVKRQLREETARAVGEGIFGVPSFVVERPGARRLFWGQDRMHLCEAWLS